MRLYQELEKGLLKKKGKKKIPSTTCAINLRQHKNSTDMQEPKIYSSPFCEAPWLTATLEASSNSRYWLAVLAPSLKADNKFTGAHMSALVATHVPIALRNVQIATPSSWWYHQGAKAAGLFSQPLGGHGSMQSVGPGLQYFKKCADWLTVCYWPVQLHHGPANGMTVEVLSQSYFPITAVRKKNQLLGRNHN